MKSELTTKNTLKEYSDYKDKNVQKTRKKRRCAKVHEILDATSKCQGLN